MQKYDFTAPASGAPQVVNAPGRYLKYMVGNAGGNDAGLILTPGGKPGSKILLYPGQAITLPHDAAMPSAWTVANALGQAVISGTLVVGNGRLDDNTLQGTVQVIDGSKSRSLNNSAFSGFAIGTNDATHYSQVQVWNPAGSGIRAVVEFMNLFDNTTSNAYLSASTVALAGLSEQGQPKLLGGSQSIAQLRGGMTVTAPGAPDNASFSIVAGQAQVWAPKEPVIVPPGYGLLVTSNVINTPLTGNFEWYEEPNV